MTERVSWRRVHAVAKYLDENRAELQALAVVRCPVRPSPTVAEVHLIDGERWLWLSGTRDTPAQLAAEGIDPASWPKTASAARPLDAGWPITGGSITACRKCRRSYVIDVKELDALTARHPASTVTLAATTRWTQATQDRG